MKVRSSMLLTAALTVTVMGIGCGGDDESSLPREASGDRSTVAANGNGKSEANQGPATGASEKAGIGTSELSKDEFIERAGNACNRERQGLFEELTAYMNKHRSKGQPEGILLANMFRAVLVPAAEAEIAAIRGLGAPEGDEDEVEAIVAAQERSLRKVRKLKRARSIEDFEDQFAAADRQLRAYGLTGCVKAA